MRLSEQSSVIEIRRECGRLYLIRFLAGAFAAFTYVASATVGGLNYSLEPLLVLVAFEIFFNFPYPVYFSSSSKAYKFLVASLMVDFAVETLAIHFIGGIDAMFFSAVYLVTIVYCALRLPSALTFFMATLASILYGGLITAEYYGVIDHRPTLGLQLSGSQQHFLVLSHVAFFYLIGFFAWYISEALIEKEKRLAALLSDLREAYHRIRYEERMKSEIMSRMSHELRAPLNSILGISQLLKLPEIGPLNSRQSELVEKIARGGRHLMDVLNDTLDFSKMEAKRLSLRYSEFDLAGTVRLALDLFFEEAVTKQLEMRFDNVIQQGYSIEADEHKVRQILYNLISNAVKYTPPGGKVLVSLEKKEQSIEIIVTDSGSGISPEDQSRIFSPYYQIENKTPNPGLTTGLGLAITKQLVEMHGGHILLKSAPGQGSEFRVVLPQKNASAPVPLETSREAA